MRERVALAAPGALLAAFLVLPLVALAGTATLAELGAGLGHPLVAPALRLSALTTTVSTCVVVILGIPLAWWLSRARGRWAAFAETVLQLPIVVPPAVAGVALLLAFGRRGVLGPALEALGVTIPFSTAAVVLAEVFVAAPFFLQAAVSAFRRIDHRLILVARSFGATPATVLLRVALPLAAPGLVAGAAMSWARALGEFGATLMFAGNLEGATQTLPLAIYTALESDLRAAQAISLILVVVAFVLLVVVRVTLHRFERALGPAA